MTDSKAVRLTVNLHPEVARDLERMAGISNISITTAIARAVTLWAFFESLRLRGHTALTRDARGKYRTIEPGWEP